LVGKIPGLARLANGVMSIAWLRRLAFRVGGLDPRREKADFAITPFHKQWEKAGAGAAAEGAGVGSGGPGAGAAIEGATSAGGSLPPTVRVVLWVDSFSAASSPELAHAASRVLRAAGYDVQVSSGEVCCGLTCITTGQLDGARKKPSDSLDVFGP